jgi:hypothetical protein
MLWLRNVSGSLCAEIVRGFDQNFAAAVLRH